MWCNALGIKSEPMHPGTAGKTISCETTSMGLECTVLLKGNTNVHYLILNGSHGDCKKEPMIVLDLPCMPWPLYHAHWKSFK